MYNSNSNPYPMEKIISVATYLSLGFVGFVYLLIAFLAKLGLRPFLKFHIYQSIFLSLLFAVISMIFAPLIFWIPILNRLFNVHFIGNFTIINLFTLILLIYLCAGAILGKYSYIPWVSNVIKYHVR